MAENNEFDTGNEHADSVAPMPDAAIEPKKQRATRRSKAEVEAAKAASSTKKASPLKGRKKVLTKPAALDLPDAVTNTGLKAARPGKTTSVVSDAAVDEYADLIALEEENKQLRKSLAEKLNAENADLRRKLGQG